MRVEKVMPSRVLYYFPIVHRQSDMGSLSEPIRRITVNKLGERAWRRKAVLIDRFWHGIGAALDTLSLPYTQTRIYQDGLPVCEKEGAEGRIVAEAAQMGSANYQLLVRLQEKGATIMGTESAELLVEEYTLIKKIFEAGDAKEPLQIEAAQEAASDLLLAKRDVFIAARIDRTLQAGETGVLFLGILHDLAGRLPADIQVHYPINRPSYKKKTSLVRSVSVSAPDDGS
ncbi:MAG TPA: hypothetical protein VIL51_08940 [Thermoleophilia bacterium]